MNLSFVSWEMERIVREALVVFAHKPFAFVTSVLASLKVLVEAAATTTNDQTSFVRYTSEANESLEAAIGALALLSPGHPDVLIACASATKAAHVRRAMMRYLDELHTDDIVRIGDSSRRDYLGVVVNDVSINVHFVDLTNANWAIAAATLERLDEEGRVMFVISTTRSAQFTASFHAWREFGPILFTEPNKRALSDLSIGADSAFVVVNQTSSHTMGAFFRAYRVVLNGVSM